MKNALLVSILTLAISLSSQAQSNMHGSSSNSMMYMVSGAATNVTAGVIYQKICVTPQPPGQWACPLAKLSYAQAAATAAMGLLAGRGKDDSQCVNQITCNPNALGAGTVGGDGLTPPDLNPSVNSREGSASRGVAMNKLAANDAAVLNQLSAIQKQAEAGKRQLAEMGYDYDPKTNSVKTPSGNSVAASNYASPQAMEAAGLTKDQIKSAMEVMKTAAKVSANAPTFTVDQGGGSLRRPTSRAGQDSTFDMNAYLRGLNGSSRKPASTDLAGLKKYVGNEPIGVAVDNIFDMVSRQYRTQATQGAFLP